MTQIKALGELIKWVDCRNGELQSDKLLGINIDKKFMPSVANIIGTDLTKYKLVFENQFACNPMHVGRDEKMPIALYKDKNPAIVSPAYFVFEVKDRSVINPEYFMLWFSRPEFDRECWFHTDGSVRGGITWDEIIEMIVPIPTIEEQEKIVAQYNEIERRIENKRKINDNLESQALAIFEERFDINKSSSISKTVPAESIFDISIGKTPQREQLEYFSADSNDSLWISISDMRSQGMFVRSTQERVTQKAILECNMKVIPANTVIYSF